MIIALGGRAGSGKSTIARKLAKYFGYDHYSMGDFQRELAAERGLSIAEWGEIQKSDQKYDRMVDDKQVKLGKSKNNFVIDAWLAPHFIPRAIKIYLDVSIDVSVKRRTKMAVRKTEKYKNAEEAKRIMLQREETNRKRWIKFYGFDFMDKIIFDLVINTDSLNEDRVFEKIIKFIKKKQKN